MAMVNNELFPGVNFRSRLSGGEGLAPGWKVYVIKQLTSSSSAASSTLTRPAEIKKDAPPPHFNPMKVDGFGTERPHDHSVLVSTRVNCAGRSLGVWSVFPNATKRQHPVPSQSLGPQLPPLKETEQLQLMAFGNP
ncbi:hypothetical protein PGTUg99_016633 [Puccinia graminis f. sp. tritici]|uniref:Uncharacterized protein n=1 Tax=Puccinia graminis f. sp. tritici TaxID=56615 RepID=A0A5B0RNA3_PUCGR|nr:hypothetical protein PGTUg99_016633 [Puccinia graminis f. sp. tritici]